MDRAFAIVVPLTVAACATAPPSSTPPTERTAVIKLADLSEPYVDGEGTTYVARYLPLAAIRKAPQKYVPPDVTQAELSSVVAHLERAAAEVARETGTTITVPPGMEDAPDWVFLGSGMVTTEEGQPILLGVGVAPGIKNADLALKAAENRARGQLEQAIALLTASVMKDYSMSIATGDLNSAPYEATPAPPTDRERYGRTDESPFVTVQAEPLSTFGVDVDTAAYANVRRFLSEGRLPPKDAVRIEELVNYFSYNDPLPDAEAPFSVNVELAPCPWAPGHRLARIGLRSTPIPVEARAASNLVFLLDVSGSMNDPLKLPLLKRALGLLVRNLAAKDRVAIVVYAGASGLVLPSTPVSEAPKIFEALDRLAAGGSTNGGAGIELAYKVAQDNFIQGGVNRVILATDGDFNVGATDDGALTRLVEEKAQGGVFLTVLGFGRGNYNESLMQQLATRGNGNHGYVDSIAEARRLLVEQMGGTLVTIAKDVKIQVEFNPARVSAYRLIGYENRRLAAEDFADDTKDAGEMGAGHTVTALYELIPPERGAGVRRPPKLRYQDKRAAKKDLAHELMTVKVRYKKPEGDTSQLIKVPVIDPGASPAALSTDLRFAAAVAGFGLLLRESPHRGTLTYGQVLQLAEDGRGPDDRGHRAAFIGLVKRAQTLKPPTR